MNYKNGKKNYKFYRSNVPHIVSGKKKNLRREYTYSFNLKKTVLLFNI